MATELDKLIVKVQADISGLQRGLAKANTAVTGASKKMSGGFDRANKSLDKFAMSALKVGAIVAGAIGVVAVKGFVDVAIQIENLQVRLKALFGSAEEGGKAFDNMAKFASKVPFSLAEIQRGSGSLAVVADDADHLAKLMEITGNVAAITGLSFQATSEQIQRSFAGGIASADMFREKGVRQMLGFKMGATVSIEETALAFEKVFGKGGKFGNATEELAKTLTGTVSMIGDKFFNFQRAVGEGFFDVLKNKMNKFNRELGENELKINAFAEDIGGVLASAINNFGTALKILTFSLQAVLSLMLATFGVNMAMAIFTIGKAVRDLTIAIYMMSTALMASGIGAILILTAKLLLAVGVFFGLNMAMDNYNEKLNEQQRRGQRTAEIVGRLSQTYDLATGKIQENSDAMKRAKLEAQKFAVVEEQLSEITDRVKKVFDEAGTSISDAFADAVVSGNSFKDAMKNIFRSIVTQIISAVTHVLILKPILDSLNLQLEDAKHNMLELQRTAGGVQGGFSDALMQGIKSAFGYGASSGLGANSTTAVNPTGGSEVGSVVNSADGSALYTQQQPMEYFYPNGRYSGGFVSPSMPYMVGEKGAELFMPKSAGTIIPNNKMGGGGVTINQSLNFSTGVVPTVRAEIRNLMPVIKKETVMAVAEAKSRGGSFARTFGS